MIYSAVAEQSLLKFRSSTMRLTVSRGAGLKIEKKKV